MSGIPKRIRIAGLLSAALHSVFFINVIFLNTSQLGINSTEDQDRLNIFDVSFIQTDFLPAVKSFETKQNHSKSENTGNKYLPISEADDLPSLEDPESFAEQLRQNYPESARLRGIESTVTVQIKLSSEGKVENVTIIKSGGEQFDKAVILVISRTSFKPAKKQGQAIPVTMFLPIRFSLK